jgi:hypothetical protein
MRANLVDGILPRRRLKRFGHCYGVEAMSPQPRMLIAIGSSPSSEGRIAEKIVGRHRCSSTDGKEREVR